MVRSLEVSAWRWVKLGFCFLVKNGLNQLSLWQRFLASASPDSFGVYVHAKTSTPHPVLAGSWVDPSPLATAWGDQSLVAASQRLFAAAMDDGCDSMVLVSGDMLPLQSFAWIRSFCEETRLSVQPRWGLNRRQRLANAERFARLSPYFGLSLDRLRKQNMFFVIRRDAVCRISSMANLESFPLQQLADEYYWINHLISLRLRWKPSNVVFCNPDFTRTQAISMALTPELLRKSRAAGFGFIRKVASVDQQARQYLEVIYDSR